MEMTKGQARDVALQNSIVLNAFELLATPLILFNSKLVVTFANTAFKNIDNLNAQLPFLLADCVAITPKLKPKQLPAKGEELKVDCQIGQNGFAGTISLLDGDSYLLQLTPNIKQQQFFDALETQLKDHAIVFLDSKKKLLGWNTAAQLLFGHNRQHIIEHGLDITFGEGDIAKRTPEKLLKEAAINGYAEHNGIRVRKDGSKFWGNEVVTALYDQNHKVNGYICIVRDRTEIKLEQEMLVRELSTFRTMVSSFPNSTIFFFDKNQNCTLAEGLDFENLGVKRNGVIDKPVTKLFPKEINVQAHELIQTALSGKPADIEVVYNGRYFLFNALPVKDNAKRVTSAVLICQDISRIKQADKDLSTFNNLLVSVFEGTQDVIFVKDLHGKYLMINPAASRYFGKTPNEIVGKDDYALFGMKDAEKIIEIDESIIKEGKSYTYQRTSAINGEGVTFYTTKSPMRDHEGNTIGLIGISRDITERFKVEEELRKAKSDLQMAQEIARICSYEFDVVNNKVTWSPNTQQLLGLPPNEKMSAGTLRSMIVPENVDSVYDDFDKAVAKKSGYKQSFKLKKPNGEIIYLESIGRPTLSKSGKLLKMVGTLQDVTAEKLADEKVAKLNEELEQRVLKRTKQLNKALAAIQDREEHFRALIQNSSDAIQLIDKNGKATYFSDSVKSILGHMPNDLLGKPIMSLIHPDDHEKVALLLKEALNFEAKPIIFVARMLHKNDTWRWMETTINNMLHNPAINAMVINYHDITDRVMYQEALEQLNLTLEEKVQERTHQLERANKELEAFTYSVSHDLRAPLRAIVGFGKVLDRDHMNQLPAEGSRMLRIIMDNSQKMGQLIDDLLEFSRVGRREQKNYLFDPTELVNEIIKDHFSNIDQQIKIEVKPMPKMLADRAMLKQVYVNLISNAVKYSSSAKPNKIEIGCTIENKKNIFYISDTGVGFDMRYKDKLFGVFQRLHSARDFEGTGVGLALVHRIILRHGGSIWAEGKVNAGATFFFSIPQNELL